MSIIAKPATLEQISSLRDLYREEMNCQIVHDSLHSRAGWALEYLLEAEGVVAGYGSILIAGPWTGTRTSFEFYVLPAYRSRAFDLFTALLAESDSTAMEIQSNDALITVMLHTFAHNIASEKIVFAEGLTTSHTLPGATLRRLDHMPAEYALELDGSVAASGGILFHYNKPYGDIYMKVEEPYRQRGIGAYLVQELKRICREMGSIPGARCDLKNIASRKTLQKAGFVPYAHMLTGSL
jgi:GNAT superfamily N-acetyltransferase